MTLYLKTTHPCNRLFSNDNPTIGLLHPTLIATGMSGALSSEALISVTIERKQTNFVDFKCFKRIGKYKQ